MDLYEVVTKLTGPIRPIGESNEDVRRFENLKVMCELVDKLTTDLHDLVISNQNNIEASRRKACNYTASFLHELNNREE